MSFDLLAPHYRWMELVLAGGKLQRCRTAFLDQVSPCRNALLLGEGNGRFLRECRRKLPRAQITCVDASARMLDSARRRVQRAGLNPAEIEFVRADALGWSSRRREFDLIVTHFFLDCFSPEQLEKVIGLAAATATPNALWLLSDFQIPPAGLPRRRAQAIHWLMYTFFRIVTRLPARRLTSPDPFLEAQGFQLAERCVSDWGLLRSDRWQRRCSSPPSS